MNLQLFAQEKTEKATPRRRQKAREQGQVFSSRELTSALILAISFLMMKAIGPKISKDISTFFTDVLGKLSSPHDIFTIDSLSKLFIESMTFIGKILAPFMLGIVSVGFFSNFLQIGGIVLSAEPMAPKLERINPLSGLKRIFSKRGLAELIKSVLKIFIVGYVAYTYISKHKDSFSLLLDMDLITASIFITNLAFELGIKAALTLLVISVFDLFYQWYEHEMSLKMSKEDVKEEYKEVEGNPQTKSRIRQIQRQMTRTRMMKDLKDADVVITNPTHLAIALIYDASEHDAPMVVAKGRGLIAEKIKEIAEEEIIPIVEDKPLAQSLYHAVEVGDSVPEDLYSAVAEILAFVYQIHEGGNFR